MTLLLRIATWLGTFASVVGAVVSVRPLHALQYGLLGTASIGVGVLIVWEICFWWRMRPKFYRRADEINAYMCRWIAAGGRVVIFTRNMSWAHVPMIRDLLLKKARERELAVCLPERIDLADELERAGAEIIVYDRLKHTPESRFTIINRDRMDAQVAVGRRIGDRHVIEEFSAGSHPVFSIANDLVQILAKIPRSYRTKS